MPGMTIDRIQFDAPSFFPTPGPWHANGTQIIGARGKRTQYVAEVLRDNGVMIARDNARLIAAAPELLNACKALLKFNEELAADLNISKHYPSADAARSAIAKAEKGAE